MTGENALRRAEDIGGQELSYAEVKAIASGNPAVLTLAEADAELQRLTLLKKNHLDEQYVARRSVRDLPTMIAGLKERLAKLGTDQETAISHAGEPMAIAGRTVHRDDLLAVLGGKLDALPTHVRETTRVPMGTYRGLAFGLIVHPNFPPDVYLEGAMTRTSGLSKEHQGPRAVLNALDRLANAYASECDRVQKDLGIAESQLRDYQARQGMPFTHEGYLTELTNLRDQLKAKLSATGNGDGSDGGPSASELAELIKALKAANNVESAPQRTGQRQSTAEEPIAASIRRRQEASVAGGEGDPESPPVQPKSMSFQERILLERLQRAEIDGQGPP